MQNGFWEMDRTAVGRLLWAGRRDSGGTYELILLVCFVLCKGQLSWKSKGERAGQSQLLRTDVVRTSGKSIHGKFNSSPETNGREEHNK